MSPAPPTPVPNSETATATGRSPSVAQGTVSAGVHDYGKCFPGADDHIIGTPGDDVLKGTGEDEYICGMGGDDTITGGGGNDQLWGGPGDDHVEGGSTVDFLYGNDGNDVVVGNSGGWQAKPDHLYGDSLGAKYADAGDDVLRSGGPGEVMWGGVGDDLLVPTPTPPNPAFALLGDVGFGSSVNAGPGNDVAVTLDFSIGVFVDTVDLDGNHDVTVPLGRTGCSVQAQIDLSSDAKPRAKKGKVSCTLPWPRRLSGLDQLLPVTAVVDDNGAVRMDMALYNQLGSMSISRYRDLVKAQASLAGDRCICDPLMTQFPPNKPIPPHDFPM